MPSLNGYWIFNNHFTTQQWDDIQQHFVGLYMNFKFYLGNYGGSESDNWSVQYEYFNYSDGIYYDGAESVHACYAMPSPSISGYYGNWTDSNLTYGPNARFINIIDDDGQGEDADFYAFWTSIASKIEYPMNNTKWLFNNTLYNRVDYAANDEDVYFTETIRSGNKMYGSISFDTYHATLWEMYYGDTSVYTNSNGWVNNTYKTISLYNTSIPSYDEWTDITNILDALALIGGNATYQGSADPKLYKLGWRVTAPVVTFNTIYLKRFWNNGTAKYKLNNGNEVTLSTSNQELTLSNVTKLEVSIDCDDIGSILIDTSSFKSFGESANLFDNDYSHSGWVDVTQYLQEGCYVSLYPRD